MKHRCPAAFLALILIFAGGRAAWPQKKSAGGPEKKAGNTRAAGRARAAGDPTLFEVCQQCSELAAFFPVDPALARRWVPPAYKLAIDPQGKATGALIFMNCPEYFRLATPNAPPLQQGKDTAPGSVAHLWFMLEGAAQVLPVPGAQVTGPTQYAYAVADLVSSEVAARVYQRAGKNAVLVRDTSLVDEGKRQTGQITFNDGSKITFEAHTEAQLATPLRVGGNVWNWRVAGPPEIGDRVPRDPAAGKTGSVNTTRVMFLGTVPWPPKSTQVTIHAEAGTLFADYFGAGDVAASRATFFRPNNIVNNSSRGELAWTDYPPPGLNCPVFSTK